MAFVRRATPADLRSYAGRSLPEHYVKWLGHAAIRDGEVVALGLMVWDSKGNVSVWYDAREQLSPFTMHRLAKQALRGLRAMGERNVAAYCDGSKIGAAMWLERLGFRPAEWTEHGQVWRCALLS